MEVSIEQSISQSPSDQYVAQNSNVLDYRATAEQNKRNGNLMSNPRCVIAKWLLDFPLDVFKQAKNMPKTLSSLMECTFLSTSIVHNGRERKCISSIQGEILSTERTFVLGATKKTFLIINFYPHSLALPNNKSDLISICQYQSAASKEGKYESICL